MAAELAALRQAFDLHQAGRHTDAERLYGDVLRRDPGNPDALHLLGMLCLDCGQPQPAAGLIAKAIQQRPLEPVYYNTLGNAFRALRKREQAMVCFRKAISLRHDFGEALTNLGSALEEAGRAAEAVTWHRQASVLQPDRAEIYGNLGNALRSANRPEEAMAAYATALRLSPGYAHAWMNLGNIYFDREEYRQAEEHYRKALALDPRLAAAQTNLGSALGRLGRFDEAEHWCRKALEAAPCDVLAQVNLASVLVMRGRAVPAAELCHLALAAIPGMPEAHTNLGLALGRMQRFEEAERHCRRALAARPDRPALYANLAHILIAGGRFAESEEYLRQALELRPDHLAVLGCYGDLCAARVDFPAALHWYNKAEQVAPEVGLTRPARALAWLAMGDFERGWEEYETRWMMADCRPPDIAAPLWDGEPFPGRTLLLHTEQGLGDTLQFVRFAPSIKRLGGRVILACQPQLMPILAGIDGVDQIVPFEGELPEFDLRLPLLSAPRVLRIREHTIPRDVPYLEVSPAAMAAARARLLERCGPADGRFRVGIVWAGNPAHPDDANRSMRLEQLDPVWRVPGAQFVSLQQGKPIPSDCPLIPLSESADSIDITAAIVLQLDLVITVDTMIAHLAGALGCPVWSLHKLGADWRWMTVREDSPWYPTMRLFRQSRFGDWEGVASRVASRLSARIAGPKVLRQVSFQVSSSLPDKEFSGTQGRPPRQEAGN